jgi:transposase, IS605 orfB family
MFHSKDITRQKYDELYDFAVLIQNHKNIVSRYVNENLLHYLDYDKFHFMKEMRERFKNVIPSSFDAQLYTQVFTCYQNKFDSIQRNLAFDVSIFKGFELYKRDTKKYKKGDLKRVLIEKKQTKLSSCLTYLARYGNEGTIAYIKSNIDKCDTNKRDFYNNILRCCEKFGFERLCALALSKRKRIINKYANNPIEFRSLTFSGRCRKKKIIDYNHRFGSVINSFISLSGFSRKSFDIPVTFNKGWHGNMNEYRKNNKDYEYILTFDEKKHQVYINLCKDGERYIPEPNGKTIGIDVNCKHNLFSLSDETTYDYDRKLVNDFCKLSLEIDRLKEDRSYVIGKRKQRKLDKLKEKVIKNEQQTIAIMCKNEKAKGTGHIVMEDLNNGFGKCYVKDSDNEDINYNRKVKFLGLSSLKQEVEHIARKYDIAVSTVQASYTSKMCPICGCIEDGNRPTQESFECVDCGHKDNADFNASKNIRDRVLVTVLRDKLLKQLDNGAFEPRSLSREKVKEVLLSFRRSLQNVGSECIGSHMITFEYV